MGKIYTKTGDKGTTSLYSGERVPKSHELIHAIGTLDECNAMLGLALALLEEENQSKQNSELSKLTLELFKVQSTLFTLGAHVATPRGRSGEPREKRTTIGEELTNEIEEWIDAWVSTLLPLHRFILPGGHKVAAALHQVRSECRHCERHLYPLLQSELIDESAFKYINRLSDYLFVSARVVNRVFKIEEKQWIAQRARCLNEQFE